MSIVSESEFKGNPMIVIKFSEEDQFPFQFGLKKAKLVLENIDAIKDFVAKAWQEFSGNSLNLH